MKNWHTKIDIHPADDLLQCIANALQEERLQVARTAASEEIEARLDTGTVAGFVEQFLLHQWHPILTAAHLSGDEEKIANCRSKMDDLIWSITPKTSLQQRQELLARLPSILAQLNAALDDAGWQDASRASFFTQLAERQAVLARNAISPRRKIEYAVTVAQKASERLMAKQVRQARLAKRARMLDEFTRTVDAMRPGEWMEFQLQPYSEEPMQRYKLAWISAGHSMFIFVRENGADFFSICHSDLCRALREKEASCVW